MPKNKDKKAQFSKLDEFEKNNGNQYDQNINRTNTFEEKINKTKNRYN